MPVAANSFKTVDSLQLLLGERLRRMRLARNQDQRAVAEKAGVSEKALRSLETGQGSTVATLLRVLKALDALDALDQLAPVATVDPLALLHQASPQQRVRRPRKLARET